LIKLWYNTKPFTINIWSKALFDGLIVNCNELSTSRAFDWYIWFFDLLRLQI
jgi:hypothetical protein